MDIRNILDILMHVYIRNIFGYAPVIIRDYMDIQAWMWIYQPVPRGGERLNPPDVSFSDGKI